jgi:hypothetical protein
MAARSAVFLKAIPWFMYWRCVENRTFDAQTGSRRRMGGRGLLEGEVWCVSRAGDMCGRPIDYLNSSDDYSSMSVFVHDAEEPTRIEIGVSGSDRPR